MSETPRAQYLMIGGFLGAGKTTAVEGLARLLTERGLRVGLITNDQSSGLVDTTILRSRGFAVEEIAGGCFCCRFDSLQEAATRLDDSNRPEVFLAEPVGSCTDLLATVSYPLRRMYGDRFAIAPLSVLVDPKRAARILGLTEGRAFSPKVRYVYEKQLEEAEIICVNKCDLLAEEEKAALVQALEQRFSRAKVHCMTAKTGEGLEEWLELLLAAESTAQTTMELDYDVYAEGEAELGWLNSTYQVRSKEPFEGNELLLGLAEELRKSVIAAEGDIAHLKMTLECKATGQLSVLSLTDADNELDLRESLVDVVPAGGTLVINLRAHLDPNSLAQATESAIAQTRDIQIEREHEEHFRPARPVPTHRIQIP